MCTVIALRRPGHQWPLILAANRDERLDRTWDAPAAYWPDAPDLIGGRDRLGGGTWMAMRGGTVAAVLNRPGSLGPEAGKRSRGELPLIALRNGTAKAAAAAVAALDAGSWRPFNMVIADGADGYFLRGVGAGQPEVATLEAGVSMITAHDPNDTASPRTARHLPRFRAAAPPDPSRGHWSVWEGLLADDEHAPDSIASALNVPPVGGFGTVCASLVAVAANGDGVWRFCQGRPHPGGFAAVLPTTG